MSKKKREGKITLVLVDIQMQWDFSDFIFQTLKPFPNPNRKAHYFTELHLCLGLVSRPTSENWYPCYTSFAAQLHSCPCCRLRDNRWGGWYSNTGLFVNRTSPPLKHTLVPRSNGTIKQVQIVMWCLHWDQQLPYFGQRSCPLSNEGRVNMEH